MTKNHHTPISSNRQPANAATFNTPLGQLDSSLSGNINEVQGARGAYGSLDDRLDALIMAGGNISTLASGAQSAGVTSLVVDDSSGFVAGAKIVYALSGGGLEYNTISAVPDGTHLTVTATGGIIPDDTVIAMISVSEYQSAGGYNTMPDRLDGIDVLPGAARMAANTLATATSLTLRTAPEAGFMGWVVIDPFTDECEVREVTSISGTTVNFSALTYAHAADDAVFLLSSPEISVKWFGATGDGTTDDTDAIQRAFDQTLYTSYYRNTKIIIPNGTYIVTASLDLTERRAVYVRGESREGVVIKSSAADKAALDLCGSWNITLEEFTIEGDETDMPACAIFQSRTTTATGYHAAYGEFRNLTLYGYFAKGCYIGYNAEVNQWHNCRFRPTEHDDLEFWFYLTAYEDTPLTSDFTTVSFDVHSCSTNWMSNCALTPNATGTKGTPIILGKKVIAFHLENTYIASSGDAQIKLIDDHTSITLRNVTSEGECSKVIYCANSGGTPTIEDLTIFQVTNTVYQDYLIYCDDGVTLSNLDVQQCRGGNNNSAMHFYNLYSSTIGFWWTSPVNGGITATQILRSDITVPPSGITVTSEQYNIFRRRGAGGDPASAGESDAFTGYLQIGNESLTNRALIRNVLKFQKADWNPGTVVAGGTYSGNFTVAGAATDSIAVASIGTTLAGIFTTCTCGTSSVRVAIYNSTASDWTPGVLTLTVFIVRLG